MLLFLFPMDYSRPWAQLSNEVVRKDGYGKAFRLWTLSPGRITEEANGKVLISGQRRHLFSRQSSWEYNRYVPKSGSLGLTVCIVTAL